MKTEIKLPKTWSISEPTRLRPSHGASLCQLVPCSASSCAKMCTANVNLLKVFLIIIPLSRRNENSELCGVCVCVCVQRQQSVFEVRSEAQTCPARALRGHWTGTVPIKDHKIWLIKMFYLFPECGGCLGFHQKSLWLSGAHISVCGRR